MSNAAEVRHSNKDVKTKLTDIFGTFDDFSQLITTPGIRRSHVHGVVPPPITPLIENSFTSDPIGEYMEKNARESEKPLPGPSTAAVLENMKNIVEKSPLSHLGTSPPYFAEPAHPNSKMSQSSSDRKRKDRDKSHDSPKKRKVDKEQPQKNPNTPPGKRFGNTKEVNIRDLFGTTSDDEEEVAKKPLALGDFHSTKAQSPKRSSPKTNLESEKKKRDQEKPTPKAIKAPQKAYDDFTTSSIPTNSPDSGISSMAGSSEAKERMLEDQQWPIDRILVELSNVKPLLSPLRLTQLPKPNMREPHKEEKLKNSESIKCQLDLSVLPTSDRRKLIERWRDANQSKARPISPMKDNKRKETRDDRPQDEPVRKPSKVENLYNHFVPAKQPESPKKSNSCAQEKLSHKKQDERRPSDEKPRREELKQPKREEPANEPVRKTETHSDKSMSIEQKVPKTATQGIATIIKANDNQKKALEPIVPSTKEEIVEPPYNSGSYQHFQNQARSFKHRADNEADRLEKTLYYLESIVFFIMSVQNSNPREFDAYNILDHTAGLLKFAMSSFLNSRQDFSAYASIRNRIKILGSLTHACIHYKMYDLKSDQAYKNYNILHQYEKDNPQSSSQSHHGQKPSASNNATPSPASSTHSSNLSSGPSPKDKVHVPVQIYNMQTTQMKWLNHMMWAHKLWNDGMMIPPENREYMNKLNELCGEIKLYSDLRQLSDFLLTGVRWLRREYHAAKSKR